MGFAIDGNEEVQLFGTNDLPSHFTPFTIGKRRKIRAACSVPVSGFWWPWRFQKKWTLDFMVLGIPTAAEKIWIPDCVCVYECWYGSLDLQEEEFQVLVYHIMRMLGIKLLPLGRIASAPNLWAIISSPKSALWNLSAFHIDPGRSRDSEKIITFCNHEFGKRCELAHSTLANAWLYVIPSCIIVVLDTLVSWADSILEEIKLVLGAEQREQRRIQPMGGINRTPRL